MRGPRVYDSNDGMNYRDINDVQSIKLRSSPPGSRLNNQDIQYQNAGYNNTRETPPRKGWPCCTKLCILGGAIGLTIGLVIAAAVITPIIVLKYEPAVGTISQTPNWIGTYQMDNACDTSSCCCLVNQIFVTEPNNQIQITGAVAGVCNNLPSTVSLTEGIPIGFQVLMSWYGETIRFQLGQDNNYLSIVNINYPYCSATALRVSFNVGTVKSMNLGLVIFTLLIIIGIMV